MRRRTKHRIVGDYDAQTKRVLLLGAGYVSAPVVEYLTRSNDVAVYVGESQSLFGFVFVFAFVSFVLRLSFLFQLNLSSSGNSIGVER